MNIRATITMTTPMMMSAMMPATILIAITTVSVHQHSYTTFFTHVILYTVYIVRSTEIAQLAVLLFLKSFQVSFIPSPHKLSCRTETAASNWNCRYLHQNFGMAFGLSLACQTNFDLSGLLYSTGVLYLRLR